MSAYQEKRYLIHINDRYTRHQIRNLACGNPDYLEVQCIIILSHWFGRPKSSDVLILCQLGLEWSLALNFLWAKIPTSLILGGLFCWILRHRGLCWQVRETCSTTWWRSCWLHKGKSWKRRDGEEDQTEGMKKFSKLVEQTNSLNYQLVDQGSGVEVNWSWPQRLVWGVGWVRLS